MPALPTAFVQTKTPAPRAVVEKPPPTVRVAYAVTIFLSAFLLFQVQLIATKFILPWFGGSPAVFTASMLFFQAGLVAGYTYANKLIHHCNLKTQKRVHLLILLLSIAILACRGLQWASPITPSLAWKPSVGDSPVWHILKVLGASVGVPYFTLSITVPLLQGWLGRSYREVSPYRFYSLSNVGSALALLSYPFFIEPLLGLRTQAWVWSVGFFIFSCSCALVALGLSAKVVEPSGPTLQRNGFGRENNPPPPPQDKLFWALLAAGGSVMMLATTNQICQGVAVIPLLWVLPLSIYLFSFVLCFDSARWYSRRWWTLVLSLATGATCFALYSPLFDVLGQIAIYSLLLFACCMVFHGELARSKPEPSYLTSFYVMVAIGGAAGGLFVTVIAPMIFKQYWELHLGLWSCWLLLTIVCCSTPEARSRAVAGEKNFPASMP